MRYMIAAPFQMSDELEKSLTHIIDSIFLIKERWSFVFTNIHYEDSNSMSRIEVLFYCFLFIVRQYYAH